jgi:CyaY protein
MSTSPAAANLSDADYQSRARAVLGAIEAQIDRWLQDDVVDIDGARTGGLLEMSFPGGSKIIVNTQPPLQEIWLAARSGGFHYRHVDGVWRDTKTGEEFFDVLSRCASEQAGQPLHFGPPDSLSS